MGKGMGARFASPVRRLEDFTAEEKAATALRDVSRRAAELADNLEKGRLPDSELKADAKELALLLGKAMGHWKGTQ